LVRPGLLFHVLFASRLSPPAPVQVRQIGSNVGELTCSRVIKATKFPAIPEAVQREQKKNYLEMSSQIGG
jgi:hypothetical protein